MLPAPESACLVIADISGYTGYVSGVELDHAQDILADLMDRIVKALRPPFRLAKLEGDAAFVYALTDKVDGSLLQDTIESAYFAFRRRLRDIRQASSCECDACRKIPTLDLKFAIHHGTVGTQKVAGREELVGRDVILIHRLLKNSVESKIGRRAYALYTDDCVKAMGIDPAAQGMIEQNETIDVIGPVRAWIKDLEMAWRDAEASRRTEVSREEASAVLAYEVPVSQQVAWEFTTFPGRRTIWAGADSIREDSPKGRRAAGTTNHCMHGKDTITEEVLDWRPYDYLTSRYQMPMPGAPKFLMTDAFVALSDGRTRIEIRIGAEKRKDKATIDKMIPMMEPMLRAAGDNLVRMLEEAAANAPTAAISEPALPSSIGRHISAA